MTDSSSISRRGVLRANAPTRQADTWIDSIRSVTHQGPGTVQIKRAIIELTPTEVIVSLQRGATAVEARRGPLEGIDLTETWPASLAKAQGVLNGLVKELGIQGYKAVVLYQAPTATGGVFSCPNAAGGRRALDAAKLALEEASHSDTGPVARDLIRLAGDRPSEIAEVAGAPALQQAHFLGAADSDASLSALAAWVESAGLKLEHLIPCEAVALAAAARSSLQLADKQGIAAVLYAGEQISALSVASKGRLWLVRSIALGTQSLIDAMTRDTRSIDGADKLTRLDRTQAAKVLAAIGVPESTDERAAIDPQTGLSARRVLTLLQPVLQRWSLEIKQSLRFGVHGSTKGPVTLTMFGAGKSVPRLDVVFSQQCSMQLADAAKDPAASEGTALARTYLTLAKVVPSLSPAKAREASRGRQLRGHLAVGCLVAGLFTTVQVWRAHHNLGLWRAEAAVSHAKADAAKPLVLASDRIHALEAAVNRAQGKIDLSLQAMPPWREALRALATEVPAGMVLREIGLDTESGTPVCRVQGLTAAGSPESSNAGIKLFMDRLQAIPIVQSCKLSRTERAGSPGRMHQSFELSIVLVGVPSIHSRLHPDRIADAATEAR